MLLKFVLNLSNNIVYLRMKYIHETFVTFIFKSLHFFTYFYADLILKICTSTRRNNKQILVKCSNHLPSWLLIIRVECAGNS